MSARFCARCRHRVRSAHLPRRDGARALKGRGLCGACYMEGSRAGWLDRYPRVSRIRDEVLEDWTVLRPQGYTVELAAPRLGMSVTALQATLRLARLAGDDRARSPIGAVSRSA